MLIRSLLIVFLTGFCMVNAVIATDANDQLILIQGFYKDQLYDLAENEAKDFITQYPSNSQISTVHFILGMIYKERKAYDSAISQFEKVIRKETSPQIRQAAYQLGRIYWIKKDYDRSGKNFRLAAESTDLSDLKGNEYYWSGMAFYHAKKFSQAVSAFQDGLPYFNLDQTIKAHFYNGLSYIELSNEKKAKTELIAAYELDSEGFASDAAMTLSYIEKKAGNLFMADLWAWRRLNEFKFSLEALQLRAEIAFISENWEEASCLFLKLADQSQTSTENLEKLYYHACASSVRWRNQQGLPVIAPISWFLVHYPQSEKRYQILEELALPRYQPLPAGFIEFLDFGFQWNKSEVAEHFTYLYMQADVLLEAFRWKVIHLQHQEKIETNDMIDMARLLDQCGSEQSAIRQFERLKSLGIETQDINFEFDHAGMLFKQKQFEEAAAQYQQWLVSHPDSNLQDEALFWLAESYYRVDKWSLSLKVFLRLLPQLQPDNSRYKTVLLRIIVIQFQLKKWSELLDAAEMFKQHFKNSPQMVSVFYQEGIAAANTGDLDRAVNSLSSALDRVDDSEFLEEIKSAIRRIETYRREQSETISSPVYSSESNQMPSSIVTE